jgi:putative heme-binding domain-containing protein
VRLQALATLDVLAAGDAEIVRAGIRDAHPAVRAQALRVSESLPSFEPALLACEIDPDFAVRRQLTFTLGTWRDPRAQTALANLVERDGDHEQMRVAILSSLPAGSALFEKLNAAPLRANAPIPALPKPTTTDRAKVIASYAQVGEMRGDAAHGRTLIQQQCAICHRFKGEGQDLGPDLGMVAEKPLDWLLAAIFDPNAAIEPRYQAQTLRLKSGAEFTGLIVAETANNVTLRLPGGTDQPVLRSELAEQKAPGHSLMPEGLESALQPQDVADVIAALRAR